MTIDPMRLLALLGREEQGDSEAVQEFVRIGASSDARLRRLQLGSLALWSMIAVQAKDTTRPWHCAAVCACGKGISLTAKAEEALLTCPGCGKVTPCVAWHGPSVAFSALT